MQKLKNIIPNILTSTRLVATPFVIFLGIKNYYMALLIVFAFVALTDFLDGYLARKWNVCTDLGAKLDTVGDKTLAIGLLCILMVKNNIYIYLLILECLIIIINLYKYLKIRTVDSLIIGKIKTWFLFMSIILGLVDTFFTKISTFINVFIVLTIIFQVLTFISYIKLYVTLKGKKKI